MVGGRRRGERIEAEGEELRGAERWTTRVRLRKRTGKRAQKKTPREPQKIGLDADFTSTQRHRRLYRHRTAEGQ